MILTVDDPVYTQTVLVAIDEPDAKAILRAVRRAGYFIADGEGLVDALAMGVAHGRTLIDPDSGAVIIRLLRLRRGNAEDMSSLVHEAVHAATMLFDRIGFPLKSKTDEPLAYYVAFVVRSVLEKVK